MSTLEHEDDGPFVHLPRCCDKPSTEAIWGLGLPDSAFVTILCESCGTELLLLDPPSSGNEVPYLGEYRRGVTAECEAAVAASEPNPLTEARDLPMGLVWDVQRVLNVHGLEPSAVDLITALDQLIKVTPEDQGGRAAALDERSVR